MVKFISRLLKHSAKVFCSICLSANAFSLMNVGIPDTCPVTEHIPKYVELLTVCLVLCMCDSLCPTRVNFEVNNVNRLEFHLIDPKHYISGM